MITRICSLLLLSACASGAATPPPPAPPAAQPTVLTRPATALAVAAIFTHLKPPRGVIYVVDGVLHTDSAFRALELGPDDVVSITISKEASRFMRDRWSPKMIIIHTRHEPPPARGPRPRSR